MGRTASGVKGIDLANGDEVVGLVKIPNGVEAELLTVTENGYGKRTDTTEYLVQAADGAKAQSRGGKGRRDIVVNALNGNVVGLLRVLEEDDLMLITKNGMIVRINAGTIRKTARNTQGVRVVNVNTDDQLAAFAKIAEDDQEDEAEGEAEKNSEKPEAE